MSNDKTDKKISNQVIVVGAGLAGLCAAIEAHRQGSKVVLVEKNPNLGGNSALASSGINATQTETQKKENIQDSFTSFIDDTLKSGQHTNNKLLVEYLVNESPNAAEFLTSLGVDLSLISQCGGHSFPRTHRAKERADGKLENMGRHIINAVVQHLQSIAQRGDVRIITNTKVEALLQDKDQNVVGIHFSSPDQQNSQSNLFGDAVILTTGGYGADRVLMEEFGVGHLATLPTTNGPWAQGEGVKMARKLGAELIDIDKVQIHPTGIIDVKDTYNLKKWLAPEAFRATGGILLNSEGFRFVNELGTRDHIVNKIFEHCKPIYPSPTTSSLNITSPKESDRIPIASYLVMNDEIAKRFDLKLFDFYKSKGFIVSFTNGEELAKFLGFPYANLCKTFEEYNSFCTTTGEKKTDQFGKTLFPVPFRTDEPLHLVLTTPSIHYTMGGVRMSNNCEVLKKDNSPIVGLYAAGEVTGGVHGSNRLAGNSLLECVVYGRRAGFAASKFRGKSHRDGITSVPDFVDHNNVAHRSALSPNEFIPLRLKERFQLNPTSHIFRFALPSPTDQMGLLAGQYIAVRAKLKGEDVVRFYSPINRNSDYGKLELLIKIEPGKMEEGTMTYHLNTLQPGDILEIKGPMGGFEYHRNTYREVGMIAGGTGISPMVQIIRSVAHHPEDKTQLRLLYGNYLEDDILCKDELMYYSSTRDNVHTYITLNNPPPHWSMGKGFISEEMIKKFMPPPANDIMIMLCGPPPMMKVMLGYLENLGYTKEMIYTNG